MGQWGKQACKVLEVEPERLWRLVPERGGTRLELTQEGFDLDSPFGRAAFDGMKPGWPDVLARLEETVGAAGGEARA